MIYYLDDTWRDGTHGQRTPITSLFRSFAADHGGAKAVIEYVGRRGARILLIGQDGTCTDQFAASTDVARSACAKAGVVVENEWERDLIEQIRPSNDLWRWMGRRSLSR